ncbi:MAG: peptidase family protein [Clostridiales bacterium]|nr:peptidase family protein [Clostridiales bacterium]
MKKCLKKYLYEFIVLIYINILICMVYLVKGRVAVFAWDAALFVVGPLGTLLVIIQLVVLIIRFIMRKEKKIRITRFVASLLLAFPMLIMTGIIFIPYPDNANGSDTVTLSMPVEGKTILLGGEDYHTHAIWPSERYAYDIMENPYDTGNTDLKSYGIYGKNVFAPIKGKIIETHDGEEDIVPNSDKFTSLLGNHVFLRIEKTGTYLIFAHLKNNSIRVAAGDIVEVGDVIAQVGNSGTTSEPHLHIQHQKNKPYNNVLMITIEGLPITFE